MKTSFIRLDALLLAAVLVLPVCKADAAPGACGPACKADSRPEPFSFATRTDVAPMALIESEAVTISGINGAAPLSIAGGEYSIEGRAYRRNPGTIRNNEQVRIRVRSSGESSGVASARLVIGGVAGTFTVKTVNFTGRVEAEAATLTGGAIRVPDRAASNRKAVLVALRGSGISFSESLDARALILAYRTESGGTLEVRVNGNPAGQFTLRPTAGRYATSSVIADIKAGDVIAIASPATGGASRARIDYVEFAASPYRSVSTLAETVPWSMDGLSVGPDGDIYVSGAHQVMRVTPGGEVSVIASGLGSGNDSGFDSSGNLYVVDYQASAVHKISPQGVMTTFASGLDGPAGLWVDPDDNVLVTLYGANFSGIGATVLSIAPDGAISTYASGGPLRDVVGIVGDDNGQVYASNYSSGVIFNITGGNVSLLAETGAGSNQLCYSHGYIYVPSPADDQIRRVTLDGTVEHFAGTSARQTIDGPIAGASFLRPSACDFGEDGSVMYVLDWESGLIRKIDSGNP